MVVTMLMVVMVVVMLSCNNHAQIKLTANPTTASLHYNEYQQDGVIAQ